MTAQTESSDYYDIRFAFGNAVLPLLETHWRSEIPSITNSSRNLTDLMRALRLFAWNYLSYVTNKPISRVGSDPYNIQPAGKGEIAVLEKEVLSRFQPCIVEGESPTHLINEIKKSIEDLCGMNAQIAA